jgi:phosphinothricin acetyltransferase
LVATLEDTVVGFAYTAPFRPKTAYQRSAEVTIYTNQKALRGTGSALYANLLTKAEDNFHRLYAVITLPNDKSIALHKKFGFAEVGMLDESGFKFGQYHSVAILEKRLA